MKHLFVYGTLKQSHARNGILRNATFKGNGSVQGPYALVDLGYFPGIIHAEEEHNVIHGEVYEVNDDILHHIDGIEGHPLFYQRKVVRTEPHGDSWAYILPQEYAAYPRIQTGIWPPKSVIP